MTVNSLLYETIALTCSKSLDGLCVPLATVHGECQVSRAQSATAVVLQGLPCVPSTLQAIWPHTADTVYTEYKYDKREARLL